MSTSQPQVTSRPQRSFADDAFKLLRWLRSQPLVDLFVVFYDNTWPGNPSSHPTTSKRSSYLETMTYVKLIPLQLLKTRSFSTSSRLRINKHCFQSPWNDFFFALKKFYSLHSQDEQTSFFILGASVQNSVWCGKHEAALLQTCRLQSPCEADAGQGGKEGESGYKYPPQRSSSLLQKQTL